ncbi:fatty acid desaturase [Flavobacteriales bacterium]|nr:fatty acid desaturase [Flavobacteriales bacterium]MDB4088332.1 fatty acid desaturase [Flavobacteriales bacterium]
MKKSNQLTLATRPFAKENRKKSWIVTISTLTLLIVGVISTYLIPYYSIKIITSILTGLLMVRFFVISHDYMHNAILAKSSIANAIFTVFGLFILVPKSVWKSSHDFHHRNNSKLYTTHIGSYPVISKQKFDSSSEKIKRKYLYSRNSFTILFGYYSLFLIGMCLRPFLNNFKTHFDSFLAFIFHISLLVLVSIFLNFYMAILLIIIPLFITGSLGSYLFYVQHNFPDVKLKCKDDWTYEGAALESSSFLKLSPIMNWFTANIGYHHIHHLNARIPFYRLPEVMNHFEELQKPKTSSLKIKEIRECLKLKVWDEKLNKMIPV